jgi:16S rRNA (cytosine967-C5)-methyltransferase
VSTLNAPLWQQLQQVATILIAVRAGNTPASGLKSIETAQRAGVQALVYAVLRQLGRAQVLRELLAPKKPSREADALLCTALALSVSDVVNDAMRDAASNAVSDAATPTTKRAANAVANAAVNNTSHLTPQNFYDPHTLVNQTVEAAKRWHATRAQAAFINACLRRFLRERAALLQTALQNPLARWNHPLWWVNKLQRDHPAHWQAILQASNVQAPMTLRINIQKLPLAGIEYARAATNLIAYQNGSYGVTLREALPVQHIPGFEAGEVSVQDAAAQLATPLLLQGLQASGARLKLLDACAAPGGKTAHLLELAQPLTGFQADVLALDVDAARCQRIHDNLQRLNLSAQVITQDAAQPEHWWDGQPFDAILLDAPCTASGIVRRHPDVRWLRRESDVAQLAAQQRLLLQKLWPLVRVGGRLLFCTCSVFKDEGENQVQTFLTNNSDATLMPSPGHLKPHSGGKAGQMPENLSYAPQLLDNDGFFYALLQKV